MLRCREGRARGSNYILDWFFVVCFVLKPKTEFIDGKIKISTVMQIRINTPKKERDSIEICNLSVRIQIVGEMLKIESNWRYSETRIEHAIKKRIQNAKHKSLTGTKRIQWNFQFVVRSNLNKLNIRIVCILSGALERNLFAIGILYCLHIHFFFSLSSI